MLPPLHHQCYQEFQQALEQLQTIVNSTDLRLPALQAKYQEVQQLYVSQIVSLSVDDVAPDYTSRWQSFQTEIHRQMRLLQTDILLLQASRSSATTLSRTSVASDRINSLIQFCQALLQQPE